MSTNPGQTGTPHVLFLCSWYPVPENPSHGIFIKRHAQALSAYIPVTVVYAYSSSENESEITHQCTDSLTEIIIKYPKTKCRMPLIKQWLQYKAYKNAYHKALDKLKVLHPNISHIQLNVVYPAAFALSMFRKHYNVPYTIAEHWSGYLPSDGNYKGLLQKRTTEKTFAQASKIWHVSEPQKQAMLAHGLKGDYELLYNAVDTSVFKPLDIPKFETLTFLHVSSLVEREKNLKGTFEALKILQNKQLPFRLIIIGGESKSISHTKALQKATGVLNVDYLGHQPPETISHYMNQSHALLLFSHFEGMPVVALEALACRLPVLATAVGHLPYLIKNAFGKLSEPGNTTQMAELLEDLINRKYAFNKKEMTGFIQQHASFKATGKQLADYYLRN